MPELCFVTTCRGRLAHLQQSLPTFAAQPGTSCVVVDYGCPDGAGDWVEQHHPQVQVVRAPGPPRFFEISNARNLGAQAAQAPWLCFVDADVLLSANFSQVVLPLLVQGYYYRPAPRIVEAAGTCICHRDDFMQVDGYDAALQGYSMEDVDLYQRLDREKVLRGKFPGELISMISHGHAMRIEHYEVKDIKVNMAINHLYCTVKWDLMRMGDRKLPASARAQLYEGVAKTVQDAFRSGKDIQFSVPVAAYKTQWSESLETSLAYRVVVRAKEGADRN